MPEELMVKHLSKDLGRSIGAVLKKTGMQGIGVFQGLKEENRQIYF